MLPYYSFLTILAIIAFMAFGTKNRTNNVGFLLLLIVMSLFAGFRSSVVGTDSAGYARTFETLSYADRQLEPGFAMLTDEPGFFYLQKILGSFSNDYLVLFTGVAFVFCLFVLFAIRKNSVMPLLSLFIFVTLGYYTFVFNAARQGIAMAIYMTAIQFLLTRKFWKYVIVVLIAALFHKTIIIAIPLYFVFTMKYSIKTLSLVFGGGLLIGYLLPSFLAFGATLEDRYALFVTGDATGGYMLTAFYIILSLFFIFQRRVMKQEVLPAYDVFLLMLITGSAIYLVVSLTGAYVELTRFAAYFQLGCIFLWAMLAKDRLRPLGGIVYIVAIIGHLGFFFIYLTRMANLTPYVFNPMLFSHFN